MATWDSVRGFALALPETSEGTHFGGIAWRVKDKMFVFERPLRKGDIAALGASAPPGPILAARVDHEGIKHALIAENPDVYFTIPHFDGYPAVLVRLDQISNKDLEELVEEAWLAQAPKRLAKDYMSARGPS